MKSQVLIVDDHPTYRDLIVAAARARGFQVLEPVETASAAISACKRHQPEIVVVDLHPTGDVDGLALCELILDMHGSTRIVAASSFMENDLMDQAFRRGVHRCLRKPFRMDEALRLFDHLASEVEEIPA